MEPRASVKDQAPSILIQELSGGFKAQGKEIDQALKELHIADLFAHLVHQLNKKIKDNTKIEKIRSELVSACPGVSPARIKFISELLSNHLKEKSKNYGWIKEKGPLGRFFIAAMIDRNLTARELRAILEKPLEFSKLPGDVQDILIEAGDDEDDETGFGRSSCSQR